MTTPEIIDRLRDGQITTTQAYNLLIDDLNDYTGNIVLGPELYLIRYFRIKIDEILNAVKDRCC